jgi:succinylarginine dihydrolase
VTEVSFDGLVGPTHHYGGLSAGNLASQRSAHSVSNPKAAAKQGLFKMKLLHDLGVPQGVLPPHARPAIDVLRALGFSGRDDQVLARAQRDDPHLLAACSSASSMWAANAATVCPSADSSDGKVHFTPANLRSNFHRAIEAPTTARVLAAIFADPERFVHHAPLPAAELFGDEGAANHTRFSWRSGARGVQLFVYGRQSIAPATSLPSRYPARQSLEASRAVARLHGLDSAHLIFAQQSPEAIDAGAFHNDVVAVGHESVFFLHEQAFYEQEAVKQEIQTRTQSRVHLLEVAASEVSLADAIVTYLFNSQLVTLPSSKMALIAPQECQDSKPIWTYLQTLLDEQDFFERIEVVDLRQSMKNGGGPACLRLRVELDEEELGAMSAATLLDEELFTRLTAWIDRHYRDRLQESDLADPSLLEESRTALDELAQLLDLGSIYPFQR